MNVNHLIYFRALAQTKSFSLAAERCFTTQPNLSYGIKALESELGIPLVKRDSRNVELTRAAELYLPYVSAALRELEQGKDALRDYYDNVDERMTIRIGGRRLNYFSTIIGRFLLEHESEKFFFEAHDYSFEKAQEQVLCDALDIATGILDEKDQKPELIYVPVKLPDLVLVVDEQHPLAAYDSISLWQLKDYGVIRKSGKGSMNQEIEAFFKKAGFSLNTTSEVATQLVQLSMVENRAGIALVADTKEIEAFRLKKIRIDWPKQDFLYCICYKKNAPMSQAVQLACTYIINEHGIHPQRSLRQLHDSIIASRELKQTT